MSTPLSPRRPLGSSGLDVSPICLGGNVFGWTADLDASFAVLDQFIELGGNFIDTANVYSGWVPGHHGGESETIIGRWLTERGVRDRVVIATKVGMGSGMFDKGLSREQIRRGAEESLSRLQVDTIDLYYAHEDDPATPLDETMAAFDELVSEGLVRAVGSSNYSADRLREALDTSARHGTAAFTAHQPHFNLLDRDSYEGPLEQLCLRARARGRPVLRAGAGLLVRQVPTRPAAADKRPRRRRGPRLYEPARVEGARDRRPNRRGTRRLADPGFDRLAARAPRHHRADRQRDLAGAGRRARRRDGGTPLARRHRGPRRRRARARAVPATGPGSVRP